MKSKETQISAAISRDTKELLEQFVRATGVKKGHLIEMALHHHLTALQELPAEVIVPPRLVISRKGGEKLAHRLGSRRSSTKALRDLMKSDGD